MTAEPETRHVFEWHSFSDRPFWPEVPTSRSRRAVRAVVRVLDTYVDWMNSRPLPVLCVWAGLLGAIGATSVLVLTGRVS